MDFSNVPALEKYTTRLLSHLGARARDFARCFDIHSSGCHKYAFIVLCGLQRREHLYIEEHHIVPMAYYRTAGLTCDRRHSQVYDGNITSLSIEEHTYAHFCMCACCINTGIQGKLIRAFYLMFYGFMEGNRLCNELYSLGVLFKFPYITEDSVISELTRRSLERLDRILNKRNKPVSAVKAPRKKRRYSYSYKQARFPVPVSEDTRKVISLFHKVLITPPVTKPFIVKLLKPLCCPVESPQPAQVQASLESIIVPTVTPYIPKYSSHARELPVYDEPLVMLHGCGV